MAEIPVNMVQKRDGQPRRRPKPSAGKPASNVLEVRVSGATDAISAEAEYERILEGWDQLPAATRDRIVRRTVTLNNMPVAPRMGSASGGLLSPHPKDNPTDFALGLGETFGGQSMDFANARLTEIAGWFIAGERPRGTVADVSAGLAFVHACNPTNHVEAQLATQMVLTNSAALKMLRQADASDMLDQKQVLGNLAVKMMRTFTLQAEALAKLQRGGEQVVKHVHIDNRGGQAVLTEQVVTGGSNAKPTEQSYGAD